MNNSKAMGLGAMMLLLVLAIVFLPMIVRYIDKMEPHYVSGFEDMVKNVNVPQDMQGSYGSTPNAPVMRCTSNKNVNCNEGQFCDNSTSACIDNYVGGDVPELGYYS